jgi:glycosyltransferase involved in cell wall biosynthesis
MNYKRVLFISPNQFGYLTDYYYFAKYLREDFDLDFICFDRGLAKRNLRRVRVDYVSFGGSKWVRHLRWVLAIRERLRSQKYDLVFLESHKHNLLIRLLLGRRKSILDIRTGAVSSSKRNNLIQNIRLRLDTLFFRNVSILSLKLREYLKLSEKKSHLLPLGAEIINGQVKNYGTLKLLYVGSLSQRGIDKTVEGFAQFYGSLTEKKGVTYDIFGFGTKDEEENLRKQIVKLNLEKVVCFHGRKNHDEIIPYYESCTVGVSFVPKTIYYNYQPPTKTFEYVLAGMVCIATSTFENARLINERNGVLCEDNADAFSIALDEVYQKRETYHHQKIISSLSGNSWVNIVKEKLIPYMNNCMS